MSLKLKDIVGNIFFTDEQEKDEEEKLTEEMQKKVSNYFLANQNSNLKTYNPFLNKNGELFNPNLDYQKLLDNQHISQVAKNYISQATGLTPTTTTTPTKTSTTSTTNTTQTSVEPIVGTKAPRVNNPETTQTNTTNTGTPQNTSQTTVQENTQTVPSTNGGDMVEIGKKYLGTPYVWGGESMDEGGMDCSGFIYNVLKDAGVNVYRDTAQGYRSDRFGGKVVNKADLQPGDIIFYGSNKSEATHIAMYIGNGQIIHSSGGSSNTKSNPGKGVSYQNLDYRSDYIEARRFTPTVQSTTTTTTTTTNTPKGELNRGKNNTTATTTTTTNKPKGELNREKNSTTTSTSSVANKVGQRIANTSTYNNDAAKGQCVWYVRGRASEKLGKDVGALGNANEMWYNAKSNAKLSATAENIKPNTIVSYKRGTSSAGQTLGHVIFIEDVVGDTVYYTEGGGGYYKNGTDGVVKTATKQGILSGVNTSGVRFGSEPIGFIDLSKY